MANQLVKKAGIYFIGNMATKVAMALMIPIYAFFVLPDALGMFDFTQALSLILAPVLYAAVWESLLRFILIENDEGTVKKTISTVALFFFLMTVLVLILAVVLLVFVDEWQEEIVCCALMIVFYSGAQIWQFFSRSLGHSKLYTASGIISALVNFFLIILLVCILRMQFLGLTISYIAGQICIFLLIEAKLKLVSKVKFSEIDSNLLKEILLFSAPLAANLVFLTIINSFGRVVVTVYFGAEANGFYTFALRFGSIVSALGGIFSMAIVEESILRIGNPDSTNFLSKIADITVGALFQLASLVLPLVAVFFFLIIDTDYYGAWPYSPFTILYGSLIVLSTVVGNVFQIAKKTGKAMLSTLFGACVVVIVSLVSAFAQSFYGIIASLLLGALTLLVARVVLGRRLIAYDFPVAKSLLFLLLYIAQIALFIYICDSGNVVFLIVWTLVAMAVFCPLLIKQYKKLSSIPDV